MADYLRKIMNEIWTGFSTFNLFPVSQYYKPRSEKEYIAEAWKKTGEAMYQALDNINEAYKGEKK